MPNIWCWCRRHHLKRNYPTGQHACTSRTIVFAWRPACRQNWPASGILAIWGKLSSEIRLYSYLKHTEDFRFNFSRFCMNNSRRYGVVDNRFCFEGGSQCGKGEGLYVFVTDQGDEITHTLKLAAQCKLSTKRRATLRKMANLESPRKPHKSRMSADIMPDENVCMAHHNMDDSNHSCICSSGNRMSYWPSQESRGLDSNYGCGDTTSVSENNDSFNDSFHFPRLVWFGFLIVFIGSRKASRFQL